MQAMQNKIVIASEPRRPAETNTINLCDCAVMFIIIRGCFRCRIIASESLHGGYPEEYYFYSLCEYLWYVDHLVRNAGHHSSNFR